LLLNIVFPVYTIPLSHTDAPLTPLPIPLTLTRVECTAAGGGVVGGAGCLGQVTCGN